MPGRNKVSGTTGRNFWPRNTASTEPVQNKKKIKYKNKRKAFLWVSASWRDKLPDATRRFLSALLGSLPNPPGGKLATDETLAVGA